MNTPTFFLAAAAGWVFPLSAGKCFSAAFAAGALLWYANAFVLDNANEGLLSAKVGLLFQGTKGWQLLIVTGVLGGILTGLGAMTGRMARDVFVVNKPKVEE